MRSANEGIEESEIRAILSEWSDEDLQNLKTILDPRGKSSKISLATEAERVEELLRRAYFSALRVNAGNSLKKVSEKIRGRAIPDIYVLPSYDKLLRKACEHTKCIVAGVPTKELEIYLVESLFIQVLASMKPQERHRVINERFDPEKVAQDAKLKGRNIAGPVTALGALAAAQASGFGVYLAATTTLGFLTHAVGVTLPFAAYTGLSSTIAVVIGPVGWLGAALWGTWLLTGTEWERIVPALVYIIQVRSRQALLDAEST